MTYGDLLGEDDDSEEEEEEKKEEVEQDLGEIQESDGESMDIGGHNDSEAVLGRKQLSHYWKKQKTMNSVVWCKDVKIGLLNGSEFAYDDFFKISRISGGISRSKISSFCVWVRPGDDRVCGLQFFYSSIDEPEKIIPGFQSRSKSIWTRNQANTKEFKLLPNEYIVELTGTTGMAINQFGVKTSLGNYYFFGGQNKCEYSVKAPEGFHFTCFTSQFCPGWKSVSQIAAEIVRIPETKEQENQQPKQNLGEIKIYKPVFRNLIEFLTTSEILKLFRLNKSFAQFRHDEYVMSRIGMRCVYSGDPKLQKYIQKMIKHAARDVPDYRFDIIRNYIRLSKNLVPNPNGDNSFEGYDTTMAQGGSGLHLGSDGTTNYIQFSFVWGTIVWRANLANVFNTDESVQEKTLQKIQNAEYALVFGASICESGFGSIAKMKVQVFDESKEEISCIEKTYDQLSREFKYFIIKFINPNPERKPHSIAFSLSGKDTCYWNGHYGAKIRNITLKIMPIEDDQEKAYFERYVR